ncbi:MAG: hypothetical protein RLY86_3204, partial [Pseudomonadota bacterium]
MTVVVSGTNNNDILTGTLDLAEFFLGGGGNDLIDAGSGNDTLDGESGSDQLYGRDGDDVIYAGFESDVILGGSGDDRIIYRGPGEGYDIVSGDAGFDIIEARNWGDGRAFVQAAQITDIEMIVGDPTATRTIIQAAGANDTVGQTIILGNIFLQNVTDLEGGGGNDVLGGSAISTNALVIDGRGGDDVLRPGAFSNDTLIGGTGTDRVEINGSINDWSLLPLNPSNPAAGDVLLSDGIRLYTLREVESIKFLDGTVVLNSPPTTPVDPDSEPDQVVEHAPNGTYVGATFQATDPDSPSTPVTWSLANSAGGRFAIDPVTGAVTVANGALIDFETAASHTITVRATDATGASSTTDLVITVINGNDPP